MQDITKNSPPEAGAYNMVYHAGHYKNSLPEAGASNMVCSMCPMCNAAGFCEISWKRTREIKRCPMDNIKQKIKIAEERKSQGGTRT